MIDNGNTEENINFVLTAISALMVENVESISELSIFQQNPYSIWKTISQAERDLIKQYPIEAYGIFKNREIAERETVSKMGFNGRNDKSDAFRHAFYNVINAKRVGVTIAKLFSDAHESEVPQALIKEKQMDLFNNNVGHQTINGNSGKTNGELSTIIFQKLLNGELRYLSPLGSNGLPTSSTSLIPTNQ